MKSSVYINEQRREYSLYVLQSRAIPHAADGLKAAARRVLWVARDGKKRKSAALAGECMPLHPHAAPESAINTLAAHYGNNIPLLTGYGAFGTLLDSSAYGASRYTSVEMAKFTEDVVLCDIEIIPMMENYDGTLQEPKHFLPLIPIVLLNPQEGIAVGFASDILPRSLEDIIHTQIAYLSGKGFREPKPTFDPTKQKAYWNIELNKWTFVGEIKKEGAINIRVTNLPYGLTHENFISKLMKWKEESPNADWMPQIIEYTDASQKEYDILIQFKKGSLSGKSDEEILSLLELTKSVSENMNVIDFDGKRVWQPTYVELIEKFCDWRLGWYVARYERLAKLLQEEIQRYEDVITACKKHVNGATSKIDSRSELKDYLKHLGIVNLDYIADLPVYRFTEEEYQKVQTKLAEALNKMKEYKVLLKSEDERRKVYIQELIDVSSKYK